MTLQPSPGEVTQLVELASQAPSIHNTQPWHWRWTEGGLELCADRARQLELSDPRGRNLVISCGTTLNHAVVAALSLGWDVEIERLPGGPTSDVMARLVLRPRNRSDTSDADVRAIEERHTDRRGFTSWAVPDERLQHLAGLATAHGAHAVALVDPVARFQAELLVGRAAERQLSDGPIAAEQLSWVDHGSVDGIPSAVLPDQRPTTEKGGRSRFPAGCLPDREIEAESSHGLILFMAGTDETASWLAAGEALSAIWLAATAQGLSLVPISQVIEVDETRRALRADVLDGLGHPLILVRVGWQASNRSQIPRTSRRPMSEVLEFA
jgi:nitroreductase